MLKSLFGSGCKKDWSWYFEGESTVKVRDLEDILKWLAECEYVSDKELFVEEDFWQHPITFERIRKGDCEDHALWAWRKLTELGISAEFACGKTLDSESHSRHAWVTYKIGRRIYLLETTCKSTAEMVYPLPIAKDLYQPHVAVGSDFKTYVYDGILSYCMGRFEKSPSNNQPSHYTKEKE